MFLPVPLVNGSWSNLSLSIWSNNEKEEQGQTPRRFQAAAAAECLLVSSGVRCTGFFRPPVRYVYQVKNIK